MNYTHLFIFTVDINYMRMLTCTWGQQTGSDVVRFVLRTDADGVVRGAAHNLPFLSSITTRHRALYTQTHINM